MSQENVELAHRSFEAINRRDLETFLAVMAADATVQPQLPDGDDGRDGIGL
jgi:ketosteroid isomerase-like protein